jgi:hypothetical protein
MPLPVYRTVVDVLTPRLVKIPLLSIETTVLVLFTFTVVAVVTTVTVLEPLMETFTLGLARSVAVNRG